MLELRIRNKVSPAELEEKVGKVLTDDDFNVVVTGPTRVLKPDGRPLAIFLPGAVRDEITAAGDLLHSLKMPTENRGLAGGAKRVEVAPGRSRGKKIFSGVLGAMDPQGGQFPYCRLTAFTARDTEGWHELRPLFQRIAKVMSDEVPDRFRAQAKAAMATEPEWVIPGTPFTTITVNNTYPTGVHKDQGDLDAGFSTLCFSHRGPFTGGQITFPEYRVSVKGGHGDLVLMDAHDWHGNTPIYCPHLEANIWEPCGHGCERVSVVSYFRTRMQACGSAEEEDARRLERAEA